MRVEVEVATAEHLRLRATPIKTRVEARYVISIEVALVNIFAPLEDVPMHVVKTELVRLLPTHVVGQKLPNGFGIF